ncbi:hypothetical protein OGAPHI_006375 [Ogataea philodendri]|uniref:RNB domain-containing protein n=1 Tax=Ogataea philodendri TaxID=1378263 RepID=A0A9P8NYG8_9ASCO|nr:uncharacterized protein OGAPHI_006375 [Ogataea philodendri]KAH3661527.1 hypothetical protein OGAPHI_006375 [Ogataea philodendri]
MLRYTLAKQARSNLVILRGTGWRSFFSGTLRLKSKSKKKPQLELQKVFRSPSELLKVNNNDYVKSLTSDLEYFDNVRFKKPNQVWLDKKFGSAKLPDGFDYMDSLKNRTIVRKLLVKEHGNIRNRVTFNDLYHTEIDVGDVVDLSTSFGGDDLAVIVELPKSASDPRYTLLNKYGDLEFFTRKRFKCRIPRIFPKEWFTGEIVLNEVGLLEEMKSSIQPIGKVKYKLEDSPERAKLFDGVKARELDTTELTTYIVPSILSGIISTELTTLARGSRGRLPDVNLKLELAHNVLQSANGPQLYTFSDILRACESINLDHFFKLLKVREDIPVKTKLSTVHSKISDILNLKDQYSWLSMGKAIFGEFDSMAQVPPQLLYAYIVGLRKNNETFLHDTLSIFPKYVVAVPIHKLIEHSKVVDFYEESEDHYSSLSNYISRQLEGEPVHNITKPAYYDTIMEMYRLYIAGSSSGPHTESFLVKCVRKLPTHSQADITKDMIYELLLNLKQISPSENPIKWWYMSPTSGTGISSKADAENEYFSTITDDTVDLFFDFKSSDDKRPHYSDHVYCIDSPDAQEIDDGVSVKKLDDDRYLVGVFVADPSSYMEPTSVVSEIAYDRGSTLYLPDVGSSNTGVAMLPEAFTKRIQLGEFGASKRVFKVSFEVNVKTGSTSLAENGIEFGTADKFISVDYDSVHKVLDKSADSSEVIAGISSKTGVQPDIISSELEMLYKVSSTLKQQAEKAGRGTYNNVTNERRISKITEDEEQNIIIDFKDVQRNQQLKSEVLVSELMVNSNKLVGEFFSKNNIPALFKIQNPLPITSEVRRELDVLKQNPQTTVRDFLTLREFSSKSYVSPVPGLHSSLGVSSYATVTSPLRRFSDFVNHWQLSSFLSKGEPIFGPRHISAIASHLMMRNEIDRRVSSKVMTFYIFKYLKYLQTRSGTAPLVKCIVCKKASEDGLLDVLLPEYGVYGTLETAPTEESQKRLSRIEVGDVVQDAVIVDIDLADGLVLLNSQSL